MKNTTRPESQWQRLPRKPGRGQAPTYHLFLCVLVFACVVFMSLFLWPNNSYYMARPDTTKLVALASLCVFTVAGVLYLCHFLIDRERSLPIACTALIVGAGCLFLYGTVEQTAGGLILYSAVVCLLYGAYCKSWNMLDLRRIALLIVILGCVMRIAFAMSMPAYAHQHDTGWGSDFATAEGHGAYVGILYDTGALPQDNSWQLYHAPLFHILSALFFYLNMEVFGNFYFHAVENMQFLTALFSCVTLVFWDKILHALRLPRLSHILALCLLAFHPTFYFVGACVNNDMLLWMFVSMTVYYLVCWMKCPRPVTIVFMALSLGLGMMTKVSAALLAPVMAVVFLHRLVGRIRAKKGVAGLMGQYAVFGLISIPLGMWFPIRNLLLFGQGFGDVPLPAGTDSPQYVGQVPLLNRLLPVDLSTLRTPYVLWDNDDSNILIKTVKTSLFAEGFRPEWPFAESVVAMVLTVTAYVLIALSIAAMVAVLAGCRKRHSAPIYRVFGGLWLIQTAFYVYFCIDYPWQCTMDARYIVLNICISAVFLGKFGADMLARGKGGGRGAGARRVVGWTTVATILLFVLCSNLIFVSNGFLHWF